jgi:hypothetical protein
MKLAKKLFRPVPAAAVAAVFDSPGNWRVIAATGRVTLLDLWGGRGVTLTWGGGRLVEQWFRGEVKTRRATA